MDHSAPNFKYDTIRFSLGVGTQTAEAKAVPSAPALSRFLSLTQKYSEVAAKVSAVPTAKETAESRVRKHTRKSEKVG